MIDMSKINKRISVFDRLGPGNDEVGVKNTHRWALNGMFC